MTELWIHYSVEILMLILGYLADLTIVNVFFPHDISCKVPVDNFIIPFKLSLLYFRDISLKFKHDSM